MKKIEELLQKVQEIQKDLKDAHEQIDDYYSGRLQPIVGFGPMTYSNIIRGCLDRLTEIQHQLIELGMDKETAEKLCSDEPPSGDVYNDCLAFIKKMGAA